MAKFKTLRRFFKRIKFSSKKEDGVVNPTKRSERSPPSHGAGSGRSPMDAAATANSKTQPIVVVLFVIVYSNTYRLKFISKILKPLKSRSSCDTAASEGDATVFKATLEESVKDVNVVLSPPAIGGRDEEGMPVAGEDDEVDVLSPAVDSSGGTLDLTGVAAESGNAVDVMEYLAQEPLSAETCSLTTLTSLPTLTELCETDSLTTVTELSGWEDLESLELSSITSLSLSDQEVRRDEEAEELSDQEVGGNDEAEELVEEATLPIQPQHDHGGDIIVPMNNTEQSNELDIIITLLPMLVIIAFTFIMILLCLIGYV